MQTSLTILKYKSRYIPFAFLSMAIFHIPLFFNRKISFYKLMGTGKNGTFDKVPDFNQWAILCVFKEIIQDTNAAIRVLQIALNLGQLEGQLGFRFNIGLENFISNFSDVEYPIQIEIQLNKTNEEQEKNEMQKNWDLILIKFKNWKV